MSSDPSLVRVSAKGLQCWADTCRMLPGGFVLLSLFGDRNAVRAAWATLFKKDRWASCVRLGLDDVRRIEDCSYHTIQTPMSKATLHTLIVHMAATNQASPFATHFYQVGPNAEERYFETLSRRCIVPLRPSWARAIWDLGIESKNIDLLPGHGLPVYSITTEREKWEPLVKSALLDGKLS